MAPSSNNTSLPWNLVKEHNHAPIIGKTPKQIYDALKGLNESSILINDTVLKRTPFNGIISFNGTSSYDNVTFPYATVEDLCDILTRVTGYDCSSNETASDTRTLRLFPRHNITKLEPPHPPHPFTVSVSDWWHMHKGALVATIVGLVCVFVMLAVAGVWFFWVKPKRKRTALDRVREVEEANVESEKEHDEGQEQQEGQEQKDYSTDKSSEKEV